jgi:hypothetical protein
MNLFSALSLRNFDTGTREKGWREAISGRTTARARVGEEKRLFNDNDFDCDSAGSDSWCRSRRHIHDRNARADGAVLRRLSEGLYQGRSAGPGRADPVLQRLYPDQGRLQARLVGADAEMIPFVNLAFGLLLAIDIAKAFGQGAAFGVVLLFLLSGIGYLVLGFGEYRFVGAPELINAGNGVISGVNLRSPCHH